MNDQAMKQIDGDELEHTEGGIVPRDGGCIPFPFPLPDNDTFPTPSPWW